MIYVTLSNIGGELDREPITDDHTDAVKEALERLVDRIAYFAAGDVIRIVGDEE